MALNTEPPGIEVQPDGTFTFSGPTDGSSTNPKHPTLQVSGRLAGATITGTFRLAGEIIPAQGEPRCHAESLVIAFTAQCGSACPKPEPATVFPGVGIGGPGLGMRGVARIGMTERQVRALHRSSPFFARLVRCRSADRRPRCGQLGFRYGYARANYYFNPRLGTVILSGRIRTRAGVEDRSTEAQLLQAYPLARCKPGAPGFRECSLLRGTVRRGVLTKFYLYGDRLVNVALFVCTKNRSSAQFCVRAVRP